MSIHSRASEVDKGLPAKTTKEVDRTIKPFHEWKDEQYKQDQANHTPHEREWYYTAYGGFVSKRRREIAMALLHLVTQRNQPYASVRRCCERCGVASGPYYPAAGMSPRWTDDEEEWLKAEDRCS
jgi:hypothetical protein